MRKQLIGLAVLVLVLAVGITAYSQTYIKRDVPIIIDDEEAHGVKSVNVEANELLAKGVAYDISSREERLLLVAPSSSGNSLTALKEYLTTMVYDVKTGGEPGVINFDMTTHVSACFTADMSGIYYVAQSTQNEATTRQLMYATMDKTRFIRVSKADEVVSTGVIMSGDYAIYGTNTGEIKLGRSDIDAPISLYSLSSALGENYSIAKIRYFAEEDILFVSAQKEGGDKTALFVIKDQGTPMLLAESVVDFDANETAGIATYIEAGETSNKLMLYRTENGERKELRNGTLLYSVALNRTGSMLVYGERASEGATSYNIYIMTMNSETSARLLSEVRLANRKILWGQGNTLYISVQSAQEPTADSILLSDIYRCKFTITTH